jgi:hypothetical protein
MLKILALSRDCLFSPSRGAQANRKNGNIPQNLIIYALFLFGSLIFYWLKPWNFPDHYAPFPRDIQDFSFWFRVMLWQPPLEIVWIGCLLGLVSWLEKGNLMVRLTSALAWTAAPFILIVFYAQKQGIPKPLFALGELISFALFIPLLRRWKKEDWIPVVGFMLGINIIGLLILIPMEVSVFLNSAKLFDASQILGGLWMLWAGMMGLRALRGMRLSRAFLAMLFSLFFQIAFAFAIHFMGIVPKEILKALLYA